MIHMALLLMKPTASTLPHTVWVQVELHWQAAALLTLKPRQIAITDWTYTALLMTTTHWGLQEQPQRMTQQALSSGVSRSAAPQSWGVKAPTLSSHCHMAPLLHSNSSTCRLLQRQIRIKVNMYLQQQLLSLVRDTHLLQHLLKVTKASTWPQMVFREDKLHLL